jgi:UDP-N-acetylglucosamine 2-epimerase (non-hydrolysing)
MARRTVAVVVGTRPEAIKLAPVALELAQSWWAEPAVVVTGQHGAVVDEVLETFGLQAAVRLPDVAGGAALGRLGAGLLDRLTVAFDELDPTVVVVQGDTASTLAGALAGFFRKAPVAHVEAGLRSQDLASPFPEEANRRLVAQVAGLHLAPTTAAAVNLLDESVQASRVLITGNTVVDALRLMADRAGPDPLGDGRLDRSAGPLVVVTAHRRESWASRCAASAGRSPRSPGGTPRPRSRSPPT